MLISFLILLALSKIRLCKLEENPRVNVSILKLSIISLALVSIIEERLISVIFASAGFFMAVFSTSIKTISFWFLVFSTPLLLATFEAQVTGSKSLTIALNSVTSSPFASFSKSKVVSGEIKVPSEGPFIEKVITLSVVSNTPLLLESMVAPLGIKIWQLLGKVTPLNRILPFSPMVNELVYSVFPQ